MPSKPPRPCRAPACSGKTTAAHGYCEEHEHLHKPFASRKGSGRGGRPWRRKRDAIMKRDRWLCQPCKRAGRTTPAVHVDHIINKQSGGTDDDHNLEAICKPCHDAKTQKEAAHGRKQAGS
ncbi:HNH endonuclease [Marinobacterium lutimaris]|uniref:Putative HNH nuclease YajD n=1 Tax=Marinobacterium lutimaris TaxID=568106 RepID=A0A1H5Y9K1_9GAMM|nr:HNH endonuclease signature motif containing protein [Marinobacterium lutimaris]SEG20723.1 5-methylcytosine-specific restriction enzyme A [Marinobacterium lutimaris]